MKFSPFGKQIIDEQQRIVAQCKDESIAFALCEVASIRESDLRRIVAGAAKEIYRYKDNPAVIEFNVQEIILRHLMG